MGIANIKDLILSYDQSDHNINEVVGVYSRVAEPCQSNEVTRLEIGKNILCIIK